MKIIKFVLTLVCLFQSIPFSFAQSKVQSGWSYEIVGEVVKSSRLYMLIQNAGSSKEKRLEVNSKCEKPRVSESQFGKCTHTISISPDSKNIELNTGEEVFLPYFSGTNDELPLIIGTIRYGCCAGPNTINFYDPKSNSMGSLLSFKSGIVGVPDQIVDFNNVADTRLAILSEKDSINGKSSLIVWNYLGSDKFSKEQLKLNLPEFPECIWTIYNSLLSDNNMLEITFQLAQCDVQKENIKAQCKKSGTLWDCLEAGSH